MNCEGEHDQPTAATHLVYDPTSDSGANGTFACDACSAEALAWSHELIAEKL